MSNQRATVGSRIAPRVLKPFRPVHQKTLAEETGEGVKRNIFGFLRFSQFASVQRNRKANI